MLNPEAVRRNAALQEKFLREETQSGKVGYGNPKSIFAAENVATFYSGCVCVSSSARGGVVFRRCGFKSLAVTLHLPPPFSFLHFPLPSRGL